MPLTTSSTQPLVSKNFPEMPAEIKEKIKAVLKKYGDSDDCLREIHALTGHTYHKSILVTWRRNLRLPAKDAVIKAKNSLGHLRWKPETTGMSDFYKAEKLENQFWLEKKSTLNNAFKTTRIVA